MSLPTSRLAFRPACAALALLGLLATLAGPALAATAVHFQRESYPAFLRQLAHGEVHAVVLHPQGYKAHIALDDGGHMTVTYPPSEVAKLEAAAHAHGSSFAVATAKHKASTVHHKLRYIAGAVLIVVILVVLAVLLIGRRRALADEEDFSRDGETAPAPPGADAS
jgi:hypothetical protein